jgi:hypothetical protein
MKRMALIVTQDDSGFSSDLCLELSVCPVCGKRHYIRDCADEFIDYNMTGPIVGKYEGWDDPIELLCPQCEGLVEAVHGRDVIEQLYRDGSLEEVEEMARELLGL